MRDLALILSIGMLVSGGALGGIVLWSCKTANRVEVKTIKADTRPLKARHKPANVKSPRLVPTTREPVQWAVSEDYAAARIESAFDTPGMVLPEVKLLQEKEPIE